MTHRILLRAGNRGPNSLSIRCNFWIREIGMEPFALSSIRQSAALLQTKSCTVTSTLARTPERHAVVPEHCYLNSPPRSSELPPSSSYTLEDHPLMDESRRKHCTTVLILLRRVDWHNFDCPLPSGKAQPLALGIMLLS